MLDTATLNALTGLFKKIERPVVLTLQPGEHEKRAELVTMLEQLNDCSENLRLTNAELTLGGLASGVSFAVGPAVAQPAEIADSSRPAANPSAPVSSVAPAATNILFSGVPGGHEFNSLILAILNAGGVPIKLDETVQALVRAVEQPLVFQTVISLSCHNCPDVVQTLNQFATINPLIQHEMIDGGLFPNFVSEHDIQGVPTVMLDGKIFANGKVEPNTLVEKLTKTLNLKPQLSNEAQLFDMVILGGGPAGVAAAIYGARKGLAVALVAERFGGQVKDTLGIENLISQVETTGPKLTQAMREHVQAYPVVIKEHFAVTGLAELTPSAEFANPIHEVTLSSGERLQAKALIVATGARWRQLGVPGEQENIGKGVAYCPHCDGPFFKGKDVAVVGGGNSGVEAALDLAGMVNQVTLIEFAPELKADRVLVDQLAKRDNISILTNCMTTQIVAGDVQGQQKVTALEYQDRASEQRKQVPLAGVFIQIGLIPNTSFVHDYIELTKFKEIVIDERCHTNRVGVFAAGDVTTVPFKQIVIAMGEGSKAGLSAFEYLLKL